VHERPLCVGTGAAGWLTRVVRDHLHVNGVAAGGNQVGLQAITAALQGGWTRAAVRVSIPCTVA
jgi:hypothetical protein